LCQFKLFQIIGSSSNRFNFFITEIGIRKEERKGNCIYPTVGRTDMGLFSNGGLIDRKRLVLTFEILLLDNGQGLIMLTNDFQIMWSEIREG